MTGTFVPMVTTWEFGLTRAAADGAAQADVALAARAAEGEARAQAELVRRVMGKVRVVARALSKSTADADDAAQVALLAVLKAAATYRGDAPLEGWARRVAVRVTLKHAARERRTGRNPAHLVDEGEGGAPARASEGLPRALRDYLAELPEPQRGALVLHHALDHTVAEIAEMTDVSPDTVKGRLKLGAAALKKRVRQDLATGARRRS